MTVPKIIALASAVLFQYFLLHKLKWSWIRRLRHAAMMLKASLQESPTNSLILPNSQGKSWDLPSANWDSDAFFRRWRFGAGASCVAFLVISTILKILLVHSFAVLWFFHSILKVWMQKMQGASARQILGNSLHFSYVKFDWSLSHEHHKKNTLRIVRFFGAPLKDWGSQGSLCQ